jgi:hypothetical protein
VSAVESAAIRRTDHSGLGRIQCGSDIPDPELWVYRGRTTALLRRYFRLSIEVGRLPSMLGGEFFRAHLTYHRRYTFEDAVILVYDMERALEQLAHFGQQLIAWIVLQEYSQGEAARLLGCSRRTIARRFPEALDELSEILLRRGLLRRDKGPKASEFEEAESRVAEAKSCQEGGESLMRASVCATRRKAQGGAG